MSDLFRDRSCMHWWLRNDEGYPPIIRSIRKFVEERTSAATDIPGEDLRDMKAIFSSLNLDDSPTALPTGLEKGKDRSEELAIAGDQDWTSSAMGATAVPTIGQGHSDSYGFDDPQQYWTSEQQSGHSSGLPKRGGYP